MVAQNGPYSAPSSYVVRTIYLACMAPSSLYINVIHIETKWTTSKILEIEIFIIIKDECFDNFDLIRITYSSYTIGFANLCPLS